MAAWIAGAAAIAGKALNSNSARQADRETEHIAKNKYSWAKNDLVSAGLNPILAAQGGISGGGGQGAQANQSGVISSAADIALKETELEKMGTEVEKNIQDRNIGEEQQKLLREQQQLMSEQTKGQKFENVTKGLEAEIDSSAYGKATRYIKRTTDLVPNIGFGKIIGKGSTAKGIEKGTSGKQLPKKSTVMKKKTTIQRKRNARGQ